MSLTMQPSESVTEVSAGTLLRITARPGQKGDKGDPGMSLTKSEVTPDGDLILTFSDGEAVNVGRVVGGRGNDGRGVTGSAVVGDELVISYTDGAADTVGRVVGAKGDTGLGIAGAEISLKGDLVLILTDGNRIEVGRVKGRPGDSVKGDRGDDGVSVVALRLDEAGVFTAHYSNGREEVAGNIVLPKDGRSVSGAEVTADGKLAVSFSDGQTVIAGHVTGGKGDPGRGITGTRLTDEGDLAIAYTDGREDIVGHVVGPQPDDGIDGRGIDDAEITADGELILKFSDKTEKNLGRVVGEDGKAVAGAAQQRGRTLYGSGGRLTADRKPPGPTNTLNIPDGFTRAVTLLISDCVGAACKIEGQHSCAGGVVSWEEWDRKGSAAITVAPDQDNQGLAITAEKPGTWVCRMIGTPE